MDLQILKTVPNGTLLDTYIGTIHNVLLKWKKSANFDVFNM